MRSKQRTPAIAFIIKTTLLAAILLAGYYWGWLKPSLVLPDALTAAKTQLAQQHANLLQNRLALTELTRLDTTSANVHQEKGSLLATLERTNEAGFNALKNLPPLPKITGAPTALLNFLNRDLTPAFRTLSEKHRSILEDQQELLTNLKNIDTALANVFRYNPELDLDGLDPATDQREIVKRSQAARNGLSEIAKQLKMMNFPDDQRTNVLNKIHEVQTSLDELIGFSEAGDTQKISDARTTVIRQFVELKDQALDAELALIKSDTAVTLLTTQTNLILEYDYWLSRISATLSALEKASAKAPDLGSASVR